MLLTDEHQEPLAEACVGFASLCPLALSPSPHALHTHETRPTQRACRAACLPASTRGRPRRMPLPLPAAEGSRMLDLTAPPPPGALQRSDTQAPACLHRSVVDMHACMRYAMCLSRSLGLLRQLPHAVPRPYLPRHTMRATHAPRPSPATATATWAGRAGQGAEAVTAPLGAAHHHHQPPVRRSQAGPHHMPRSPQTPGRGQRQQAMAMPQLRNPEFNIQVQARTS